MKLILPLVLVLAPFAVAQDTFFADIDGSQEVPSVTTNAAGWAKLTLNSDNTVTYDVRVWKMNGTAAHIHTGAVGVNGGIVKTLAGGPKIWSGTTTALTAGEATTFRTSGMYVNVHSAAEPLGEIRGQVVPRPVRFAAYLDEAQEVPATGETTLGTGEFEVDPASLDMDFDVQTDIPDPTNAHLHDGDVGMNGGIVYGLLAGGPNWSGTINAIDHTELTSLQNDEYYVNAHSVSHSGGEIRGQVVPDGIKYADVPTAPLDFDVTGAAYDNSTITMSVSGGTPNTSLFLFAATAPGNGTAKGKPFVVDSGSLVVDALLLGLDGTGSLNASFTLDPGNPDLDVYVQVFNAPGGPITASNGVIIPFRDVP